MTRSFVVVSALVGLAFIGVSCSSPKAAEPSARVRPIINEPLTPVVPASQQIKPKEEGEPDLRFQGVVKKPDGSHIFMITVVNMSRTYFVKQGDEFLQFKVLAYNSERDSIRIRNMRTDEEFWLQKKR